MNLREKFIWNIVIAFSVGVLFWKVWGQFNKHTIISKAYNKFINEEVGTDKELQNMVSVLEKNLNARQTLKFNPKENPLDLTKVITLDGELSSRGVKGIECSSIITIDRDGNLGSICTYRSKRHVVVIGDSLGGGLVTNISSNTVYIEKNNEDIVLEVY